MWHFGNYDVPSRHTFSLQQGQASRTISIRLAQNTNTVFQKNRDLIFTQRFFTLLVRLYHVNTSESDVNRF